ncbi:heavy metal translocating P-type ATPase [Leptotrichia buccalis]|uniref:Heavy metal translocating P-type ATPase n=1 Tax=Leptotrichia buccalis (strain ATCC 14201 / DSM 1135 / JCM 12969 / NCTC 10249 / C-1013-b) TaxID=523794 RepID=C7N9B6_LEPBD|nr:heavy metal translocating P-type ATPase [Leptotrichia buccalis]ACV38747.1 heavy metal translocating P-type ATPase [Leptotrichia buccalis C-1013-b]
MKTNECTLFIEGLDCPNCAAKIERKLNTLQRIKAATVDFLGKRVIVESEDFSQDELAKFIQTEVDKIEDGVKISTKRLHSHGHTHHHSHSNSHVHSHSHTHGEGDTDKIKKKLLIGGIIFVLGIFIPKTLFIPKFAVFLVSYFIIGGDVLVSAVKNILRGQVFDENFLMSIATIGAFAIGEYPEGVAVMLFYQLGELFQGIAVNNSRKSIIALMDIRPDYANLKTDSEIKKVNPDEIKVADIIVVKPGEKVPLDGKIITGNSTFDTSALTGESLPREAKTGDIVLSGFINKTGLVEIEVTKVFSESTVSKILDLVENSSSKKSKTENFITKFAKYYTPAVVITALIMAIFPPLLISGATFTDWIYRALIFLVVSCPCALIISIPLGFFGGIGGASKHGILVKGANYLEALNDVESIVMDKTGTLTKGVFKVTEINVENNVKINDFENNKTDLTQPLLLKYAAHIEKFSNHPIAQSIVSEYENSIAKTDESIVKDFKEISGFGIKANINNHQILAGNSKLMNSENIRFDKKENLGTVVYIAFNRQYIGNILISDEIKEDSPKAIRGMKANGIKEIVMLTGDNNAIGKNIAEKLEIDKVFAELLPNEKVEKLEEIYKTKSEKGKVVFVGDGINDAPVLARADIGIAMGGVGSDAAIEAADVVIMNDEPSKIVTAMKIAKKTKTIVWQNITLAFAVKLIVLILGLFGDATMWEAVFADVGVALLAVLNATRVLKYKVNENY